MAQFIFKFVYINIKSLRSTNSDTDFASLAVKVGDKNYGPVKKAMGDLHKGTHPVELSIGPIDIPNDQTAVLIGWTVMNLGHKDPSQAAAAAATAAGTIVGTITLGAPLIGPALGVIVGALTGAIGDLTDHDGPCVVQSAAMTGQQMNTGVKHEWNPQFENHKGDDGRYDSYVVAYQPSAFPKGIN